MTVRVERRLFDANEYHRMAEAGVLSEDDRVELIEGEILRMAAVGSRHAACVKRLNALLVGLVGGTAIVAVQDPIRLDYRSEPEPDIALLEPREDFYAGGHPTPDDVFLLIEVADTSLEYDREVKLPLYATAGIAETWLVDLDAQTIESYARPENGVYASVGRIGRDELLLAPQAIPDLTLAVDDILG
jgi:Uma2 family endonuclease